MNQVTTTANIQPHDRADCDTLTVTPIMLRIVANDVHRCIDKMTRQTPQIHRAQTDETNTDKKLIAMLAILLAKQSNTFRTGNRPNATEINKQVYKLATDMELDKEDMTGLKANIDKISKAIQAHADMFKLSKD